MWTIILLINIFCVLSLIFIERREPNTTWAWLLIFILLPGIGFIIYLIFGQNLIREKIFNEKKINDEIRTKKIRENLNLKHDINNVDYFLSTIKLNYNQSGALYLDGNDVKMYTLGEEKFKSLFEDIKNAKKFIHIEYYIFRMDGLGVSLLYELHQKVKEGVEVRFIVDAMGSKALRKKHIEYIKSLGIDFHIFFPVKVPRLNPRLNFRNHRKIVVIDGEIGYVGGFNVGDEYVNMGEQFDFWRDTHIRIKGNAVDELNKRFILDFEHVSGRELDNHLKYFPEKDSYGNVGIQIVSSGPDNKEEYIKSAYIKIINNAKEYVYIQTPYLVLDEPMKEALQLAALSGVDVRLIVPDKPDHFYMAWMLSATIGELMGFGVKFYKYQKGFIHSKTMVADGLIASIGTANMDIRSFRLNFEVNAILYGEEFAAKCSETFLKDLEDCKLVTKEEYEQRSNILKIKESIIRLLSPLL